MAIRIVFLVSSFRPRENKAKAREVNTEVSEPPLFSSETRSVPT